MAFRRLRRAGRLLLAMKRKCRSERLAHRRGRAVVTRLSAEAERSGGRRPATWLGKDGERPLLAALLKETHLYVGHDTGAMHMAAAVGRPVVGVFGGGHWPRFRPSARQAASVVQPLPCFGCSWDCHYGDGPCVKTIPASDVIKAIERLLAEGDKSVDFVLELPDSPRRPSIRSPPRSRG